MFSVLALTRYDVVRMRAPRKLFLAVVIGFVVLELLLQVGTLVVLWTVGGDSGSSAKGGPVVLCVGDSYTYGLGASSTDKSYPGVMQTLLQTHRPGVRVVNAGWPSRNSREVLAGLDRQLAAHRPKLVFLLVGLNDAWAKPERLDPDTLSANDGDGWHWRWRTGRLFQLMFGGDDYGAGRLDDEAAGAVAGATPSLVRPELGVPEMPVDRALAKMQAGDGPGAIALLEGAIVSDPDNAANYRQGLVQFNMMLAQPAQAKAVLAALEQEWQLNKTSKVAEALAVSLAAVGERSRATDLARTGTQLHPDNSSLWWLLGQGLYNDDDFGGAESALDRAIAIAAKADDRQWHAVVLRDGARASCHRDTDKATRQLLKAMRIDGNIELCRIIVEGVPQNFGDAAVTACLAKMTLTERDEELVQRLFTARESSSQEHCATLEFHLTAIVERCRAHGAEPVMMTYPLPVRAIEAVQENVAKATSMQLVRVMPVFAAELRKRPASDLYIADRHCSDGGYALMARLAAAVAEQQLAR